MVDTISDQLNSVEKLSEKGMEFMWAYGPKLLLAIVTLIIGLWLINKVNGVFKRNFNKRDLDPSLTPFLLTLINVSLKIMLFISVIGMLGVQMTSFVAVLGAAGLAIALSLQGTLQNFASGIMILVFKPFKVGDFIEAAGYVGKVKEIQIFNTLLTTPDNKRVIIPNGSLSGNSMTNYTSESTRRVDWTFGIAYGDSYNVAKDVLQKYIKEDIRIHSDPEPFIALSSLGDSSVNIVVRVWVFPDDFWPVFFDMNEKVYNGFKEEGLSIPFPQMDVHLYKSV